MTSIKCCVKKSYQIHNPLIICSTSPVHIWNLNLASIGLTDVIMTRGAWFSADAVLTINLTIFFKCFFGFSCFSIYLFLIRGNDSKWVMICEQRSQLFENSLRLSAIIWQYDAWSKLLQVKAQYQKTPSHYANQYWLIVNWILGDKLSVKF